MKNPFNKSNKTSESRQAQSFIDAARDFEKAKIDDVIQREQIFKTIAVVMTGIAILTTVSAAVAIFKRVEPEPVVIQLDKGTGIASIVRSIKDTSDKYDEVIDKYWLGVYVEAREGYDWYTISTMFEKVKLMSSTPIGTGYALKVQEKSSPMELLKDKSKIQVKVNSVSFVKDLAQVRFSTEKVDSTGVNTDGSPVQNWVATIAYTYKAGVMTEAERRINPLGFKVYSYNVSAEVTK